MPHPSRSYTLKTSSARPTPCVPSTAIVRTLCVATAISRPRVRARFLLLLCLRRRLSAPLRRRRLRAEIFLLSTAFSIFLLPYPRSCLVLCSRDVGSAVPPRVARPSSVSGANLVLTHRLLSFLPLSAAVLYCTVLYCTPILMSWPLVRTA